MAPGVGAGTLQADENALHFVALPIAQKRFVLLNPFFFISHQLLRVESQIYIHILNLSAYDFKEHMI